MTQIWDFSAGRSGWLAEDRAAVAEERERIADQRERIARERERLADEQEALADRLEAFLSGGPGPADQHTSRDELRGLGELRRANRSARARQQDRAERAGEGSRSPDVSGDKREFCADDREQQADRAERLADRREQLAVEREQLLDSMASGSPFGATAGERGSGGFDLSQMTSLRAAAAAARQAAAAAREAAAAARSRAAQRREVPAGSLAAAFEAITAALVQAAIPVQAFSEIAGHSQRLTGAAAASVTMLQDSGPRTVAATAELAELIDSLQYRTDQGPCLQSIRTGRVVMSGELAADRRWPQLARQVAESAVGGALAAPVADHMADPEDAPLFVGSLNHYSRTGVAFGLADAETALLLAAHISAILRIAAQNHHARDEAVNLQQALLSRDVIGQAKGILMERHKLTAAQAYEVLNRASQKMNRKLRDIAEELTRTGQIGP